VADEPAVLLLDWVLLWLPRLSTPTFAARFVGINWNAIAEDWAVCPVLLVWVEVCDPLVEPPPQPL